FQHAPTLRLARRADQRLDAALVRPHAADAAEQGFIAGQAGQAAAAKLRLLPAVTVRVGVGCRCHGADYNGSRPGPPTLRPAGQACLESRLWDRTPSYPPPCKGEEGPSGDHRSLRGQEGVL